MNIHFIKGFTKTAEPELAKQVSTGVEWDKPGEHRNKRQKLLETYSGHPDAIKKKNYAVKEQPTKNPNDYSSMGGTPYVG